MVRSQEGKVLMDFGTSTALDGCARLCAKHYLSLVHLVR